MSINWKHTAGVALIAMTTSLCANAAAKKAPNLGEAAAATPAATAVETIATASALARYGDSAKDPLALIVAAKMVRSTGRTDSTAQRVSGTPADAKNKPDNLSVDGLLTRARSLAGDRKDVLALADDVAQSGARGATGGPGSKRTVVANRAVDVYRINFRGGEAARVLVSGDGDSDLDLYVYDEAGNLICKDDDNTDDMICAWSPRWTGPFTIRVRNRGIANEYVIVHN